MACSPYLTDLATVIWNDLGQPSGMPVSFIQSQLVSNSYVGRLNNQIATCYTSVSGDISPALGNTEQAIYAMMYEMGYYQTKLAQTLAGLNPGIVSLQDGDSRIVFTNSVEQAKVYKEMQKQLNDQLTMAVSQYRQQESQPSAVDMPLIVNGAWAYGSLGGIAGQIALYGYYRN